MLSIFIRSLLIGLFLAFAGIYTATHRNNYLNKNTEYQYVMTMPGYMKWLAIGFIIFWGVIEVLAMNGGAYMDVLIFFAAMLLMCVVILLYSLNWSIKVRGEEIYYTSFLGRSKKYSFKDITKVKYLGNEMLVFSGWKLMFTIDNTVDSILFKESLRKRKLLKK